MNLILKMTQIACSASVTFAGSAVQARTAHKSAGWAMRRHEMESVRLGAVRVETAEG